MRLFQLWGGLGAFASHMVKETTNVQQYLDPWIHPKYDWCVDLISIWLTLSSSFSISRQYIQVGTMCGRSSNYDKNAERRCSMGYDVQSFENTNHWITKYSKTGAGKYKFKPNSNNANLPTLEITKLKVFDTIGESYKFDFKQNYMGFIFWGRQVRFLLKKIR